MDEIDYNREGRWSIAAIQERYLEYSAKIGGVPRDLSPREHSERERHWVYPVMDKIIEGIESGDLACIRIGIEFMEEDAKFPFGKILKSNTARALGRASLSDEQKYRIRRRVFSLLQSGHVPHEFHEYAKLVRKIGFDLAEVPDGSSPDPRVQRFCSYFKAASRRAT